MGARGRKPDSAVSHLDLVIKEKPKPPRSLSKRAKDTWKRVVDSLPVEHFRQSDLPLLEKYCMADSLYWQAMDQVMETGELTVKTKSGYETPSALVTVTNKQAQVMATLATKLRICPNSRVSQHQARDEKEETVTSKRAGLMYGG